MSMAAVSWLILRHESHVIAQQLTARGVVQAQNLSDAGKNYITNKDDVGLNQLVQDAVGIKAVLPAETGDGSLPERIRDFVDGVADQVVALGWPDDIAGSRKNDLLYAQIVGADGIILASSLGLDQMLIPYEYPPGVKPNATGKPLVQETVFSGTEIFDIDVPMSIADVPLGSVHLGLSRAPLTRALHRGLATISVVVAVVVAVAFLFTTLIVAAMTRPVGDLVKGVLAVASGDLNQKLPIRSRDELGELSHAFNEMTQSLQEKEKMRGAFTKYVSAAVVDQALSGATVTVGGERRNVTVYFSHIKHFGTISKAMKPEDLVHLLNEYFDEMMRVLDSHQGSLDKFIKDAIMAIYGAPRAYEGHGLKAVTGALEMRDRLDQLRPKWMAEGKPEIRVGMGIATDSVIVGNVGSSERLSYTAMGDGVNLAARLEGTAKVYGVPIILSENTWLQAREGVLTRELDLLRVIGKKQPVRIFEAVERMGKATDNQRTVVDQFHFGLSLYRQQRWDEAVKNFEAVLGIQPQDGPSKLFVDRCARYKAHPPGPAWDAVAEMQSK